jgi:hypothetical protein
MHITTGGGSSGVQVSLLQFSTAVVERSREET